jgi:competence protein ComEA
VPTTIEAELPEPTPDPVEDATYHRATVHDAWSERLPPTLRGGRLAMDPRAAAGLALIIVLVVAFGGSYLWRARPDAVVAPPVGASATSSAGASAGELVVDVAGMVRRPGVVVLPAGSRVTDAIRAAGGTVRGADTTSINLARKLEDGEQILVAKSGAAPPTPVSTRSGAVPNGSSDRAARVDLNVASLEQLLSLPGVGPVLAQRILDWRTQNGRFDSVDELREVAGIGERKFADIAPRVRV